MASDPTFRKYKATQAQQYAWGRAAYPPVLYEKIFTEHATSGGEFGFLIDVGCGPGRATRDLAMAFDNAIGVDPGEAMIDAANQRGGKTMSGKDIRFEVVEAERLAEVPGVPLGGVDLITAATAAHWFDMKKFWAQAAQLLKPGGTIAIWTKGMYYAHPAWPHAAKIHEIQQEFERAIKPYYLPGNHLSQNLYDDLLLPWTADPSQVAFRKENFQRFEWDRGGLSDPEDFFGGSQEVPLAFAEHALATASPVTRWREAHPELVGTKDDVVKVVVAKMQEALGTAGIRSGGSTVLLLFKRAE